MSQNILSSTVEKNPLPPAPPPVKMYCSSAKITPTVERPGRNTFTSSASGPQGAPLPRKPSDSILVATVDGKAVGEGSGFLYSSVNGNSYPQGGPQYQGGSKPSTSDPQVRKLVYNMYRGLLNTKHDRANNIVESAPQQNVLTDEGVGERVVSMMRHQSELREGKMMNYGPPPPPPPPPFSTGAPAAPPAPKPAPEVMPKASPPVAVPAALAGAMMKDKKPFTYTPGGLNLAEINAQNQPQQNGVPVMVHSQGVHDPVMQSRSFKVLQNAYDNQDPTGGQQLQSDNPQEPKKYMGSHIPSRSFRMLQAMTDADDGPGPGESDL